MKREVKIIFGLSAAVTTAAIAKYDFDVNTVTALGVGVATPVVMLMAKVMAEVLFYTSVLAAVSGDQSEEAIRVKQGVSKRLHGILNGSCGLGD